MADQDQNNGVGQQVNQKSSEDMRKQLASRLQSLQKPSPASDTSTAKGQ